MTYPRSLIFHGDGTVAGYTLDDELDRCRGRETRHEGDGWRVALVGWLRLLRSAVVKHGVQPTQTLGD
jgi:hypothetical protein